MGVHLDSGSRAIPENGCSNEPVFLKEKVRYTFGNFLDNYQHCPASLKTLDTIGSCQRLVFKVGVSQHMHKITNL